MIYQQAFSYNKIDLEMVIRCKCVYLPMEAKIDRESFENMLKVIQPRILILVNGYPNKHCQIEKFCQNSKLEISVMRAERNRESLKFATNAGVKQVFIEHSLLKSLSMNKVAHRKYEVARIRGEIRPQLDRQLIFDELTR